MSDESGAKPGQQLTRQQIAEEVIARLFIHQILKPNMTTKIRVCETLHIEPKGIERAFRIAVNKRTPSWVGDPSAITQPALPAVSKRYNSGPKPRTAAPEPTRQTGNKADGATASKTTSSPIPNAPNKQTKRRVSAKNAAPSKAKTGRLPQQQGEPATKKCSACKDAFPIESFRLTQKGLPRKDGSYRVVRDYLHHECRNAYQRSRYLTTEVATGLATVGLVLTADREMACMICGDIITEGSQAVGVAYLAHDHCALNQQDHTIDFATLTTAATTQFDAQNTLTPDAVKQNSKHQ